VRTIDIAELAHLDPGFLSFKDVDTIKEYAHAKRLAHLTGR
jgi:hypothetical protein